MHKYSFLFTVIRIKNRIKIKNKIGCLEELAMSDKTANRCTYFVTVPVIPVYFVYTNYITKINK